MQTLGLSLQFQITMAVITFIFDLLDLIPFVNVVTNAIYWLIWLGVFIFKYMPILKAVAKSGVSIGIIQLKIALISSFAALLGMVPFISMLPWNTLANWWINRLIKKLLVKIKELSKNTKKLGKGWDKHWKAYPYRRREERSNESSPQLSPGEV